LNRAWRWRTAFALVTAVAAACAPILGLDDLEPRPTTQSDSGPDTGTDSGVDSGEPCTTHAECIDRNLQGPARCVQSRCVNVDKELCNQQIIPDPALARREDTILVAAFMSGGNPAISGAGKAYTLALEELEKAGGILGSPPYHLAVLVCNADSEFAERGVKHVIQDLQLPAVIASFGTGALARLVAGDLADAGVFTMNPSFTTDFLKAARVGRRVWGLLGTGEEVALAYRPVLDRLREEKQIRPDAKVALVTTSGSLDESMGALVSEGQLTSNGTRDPSKAIAMVDGSTPAEDKEHFKHFPIESLEFATDKDKFNAAIAELKNGLETFEPDVIIAITGPELDHFLTEVDSTLVDLYATRVDAGFDASAEGGAPQRGPWWILGPSNGDLVDRGARTALGSYIHPEAGGVDQRRERIIGVQFAGAEDQTETGQAARFRGRMIERFKDAAVDGLASENFYDAIYWLAYAVRAAGDTPVSGDGFSLGVRKMFKGTREIHPGSTETIEDAYGAITTFTANGTLYVGALGRPNIDEATGTWNSVGSTYCFPPYAQGLPAPSYEVRRYSPDGGLVPGSRPLTCN
jgi:hypothetical protein